MKRINHVTYPIQARRMRRDELLYTIRDCRETILAYPESENVGYYMDEIHYCTAELKRRAK